MPARKVALIYDWLDTHYGGAEKVLEALCDIYPEADIFTAFVTRDLPDFLQGRRLFTTFLQKLPLLWPFKPLLAPLMPLAFELLNVTNYDLVISISSFAAKAVITRAEQTHICYLLTPTRFLYSHAADYFPWGKNIGLSKKLRHWDYLAARRADYIIPISHLVKNRTQEFYNLPTLPPLYPPVNARSISAAPQTSPPAPFDLIVARQVPYKRIDLAIKVCCQLKRRLKIVGTGSHHHQLISLANHLDPRHQLIEFLGLVSNQELAQLFNQAEVFLMPGREDFGITALEAAAAGTFVFLQKESGAAELLPHRQASFHLPCESVESLIAAYSWLKDHQSQINHSQIKKIALQYDVSVFKDNFLWTINDLSVSST